MKYQYAYFKKVKFFIFLSIIFLLFILNKTQLIHKLTDEVTIKLLIISKACDYLNILSISDTPKSHQRYEISSECVNLLEAIFRLAMSD